MKKGTIDIIFIIIGAFLFALGVNLFVIPNELGEGGVTGITIIAYYLFGWSPGLVSLILNAFLLIVGYKFLNKVTTIYTIIAVVFISLFLHLKESWTIASNELMLNAIFGGIFVGVGIGLIIRVGGTTAGTTILARITHKYLGWSISYGLLFFDLIVAFSSYFIIGAEKLMLTIIMLYVGTKVMEFVIEGLNPKKAITIISDKPNDIAEQVTTSMDRGVTVYSGHGYYTKTPKEILYIVISKQEVIKLKSIVQSTDPNAFIAIHDVRDVFGKTSFNYKDFNQSSALGIINQYLQRSDLFKFRFVSSFEKKTYSVDLFDCSGKINHTWKNLITIGKAKEGLHNDIQDQLRYIQQNAHSLFTLSWHF